MSIVIDGILKDWGERLNYGEVKPRKGKNIRGGSAKMQSRASKKLSAPSMNGVLKGIAKKAPEVMVKITGGGKNMGQIKAHMDYISRNGNLALEDELGELHIGMEALKDLRHFWKESGYGIPETGDRRKEAINVILSMPAGTDREAVRNAASDFAKEHFSNHQYVFVSHEDEKHSHVHICIKKVDKDGQRIFPNRDDLQSWRNSFAEHLKDYGIEANASSRRLRGAINKEEEQAIVHMDKEHSEGQRDQPSIVSQIRVDKAEQEAAGLLPKDEHKVKKIIESRKSLVGVYGRVAKELLKGDGEERQTAALLVNYLQNLPAPKTKHQQMVEQLKNKNSVDKSVTVEKDNNKGIER